jgi:hypothetical protein
MQAPAASLTPTGDRGGGLLKLKAIMRVRDFSVRNTTRVPQGDRSLPLSSRCGAVSILIGAIVLALAGTLNAQEPPAAKAAEPAPVARPTADARARAQIAIKQALMTLAEDAEYKRYYLRTKTSKVVRNGVLNPAAKTIIDAWIENRLYRMTITELPPPPKPKAPPRGAGQGPFGMGAGAAPPAPLPPLPFVRQLTAFNKTFLQEIRGAAKFQNNPGLKAEFRKYVLDGVISKSRDLFDNNYYVRLNVVLLLSQLNKVEGGFGGKGAIAYAPVAVPLLDIMQDKDQLEGVKVLTVQGLKRILLIGNVDKKRKNEIALELMSQLDQKASMYWYPMRLVEALGRIDEPLVQKLLPGAPAPVLKPFHVQKLAEVMRDQNYHWIVRSEAAKSLGRISLHATVRSDLIAHEIVVLSHSMCLAYNKNLNQFYWQQCFLNTYLAFKPLNAAERARLAQVKPANLIGKVAAQKAVGDAYQQILPPVLHILVQPVVVNNERTNTPIPAAVLQVISTWIADNKPSIDRIAPGLPQLQAPKPMAAKSGAPAVQPTVFLGNE